MITTLKDIKKHIIALKIDFETEAYTANDLELYSEISKELEVPLCVKIGGCEAFHDMTLAKNINSKSIVAPMIESDYALKKFVASAKKIFNENETDLFINIETLQGYKNLKNILESPYIKCVKGIVIGRNDLAQSFGLEKSEVNSEKISEITMDILIQAKSCGLTTALGGNLTPTSLEFLAQIPTNLLDYIETRSIILDFKNNNQGTSIKKSLEFELHWLEYKNTQQPDLQTETRITELKKRLS